MDAQSIAAEALSVLGQGRQIAPFSSRDPAFGLDEAYKVTPVVRQDRLHQQHDLGAIQRQRPDLGLHV